MQFGHDGERLYARFNFGVFTGYMQASSRELDSNGSITLQWRGRDTGEGMSDFGPLNKAFLFFLDNDTFHGTMHWNPLGTFKLVGKLDYQMGPWSGLAREWKAGYLALDQANYEREQVARWR